MFSLRSQKTVNIFATVVRFLVYAKKECRTLFGPLLFVYFIVYFPFAQHNPRTTGCF